MNTKVTQMKDKKLLFSFILLLGLTSCDSISLSSLFNFNSSSSSSSISSDESHSDENIIDGDLQFHFLELGNQFTGDCTYIKAGELDILIDAGSRSGSAETIQSYVNQYCSDGKLEYVISTHAHQDHIAGFVGNKKNKDNKTPTNFKGESVERTGIFYYYQIDNLIEFSRTDVTSALYENYKQARDTNIKAESIFTADKVAKTTYTLTSTISMTILDNYFYYNKSNDENNYSVCVMFSQTNEDNTNNYILTGDLEKAGEEYLVKMNTLPKVKLYKGGHHGSPTSSNDCLLNVIQPQICAVCCCAGSDEYTKNLDNQFPSQDFINRISKWTDKVFVTTVINNDPNSIVKYQSLNGNIIISSYGKVVNISCSNNNTILRESSWFNSLREDNTPMRIWPDE